MIEIIGPALLILGVLVIVHAQLGLQVLGRGVVFADLAIGQMAAVGMALSFLYPVLSIFWTPLLCALLAGGVVAIGVRRSSYPEAVIALLYALGGAVVMVLLSQSAEGAEQFKRMVAGELLFLGWQDLVRHLPWYGVIILILALLPRLRSNSMAELLFYLLFALTVTLSVAQAGVLVVFALLVAPALTALSQRRYPPFVVALLVGWSASMIGVLLSWYLDWPLGQSVVLSLSLLALPLSLFFKPDTSRSPQ
ncbi:MAG: metal ABC transporter permease [Campylobacterales bacterium]